MKIKIKMKSTLLQKKIWMNTWKKVDYQEPIFEMFKLLTVVHLVRFACLSRHNKLPKHDE